MFTKVFRSIYDGTLADNWQALVTFQQLLILANQDGVVDMTPQAISRTTGIPREIIEAGIQHLEAPDAASRTPDMDGRRIVRLDAHRPWGWFLVNFAKYRNLKTLEEKREADRVRVADKRARQRATECDMSQVVADSRELSERVCVVAHTEADTETNEKAKEPVSDQPQPPAEPLTLTPPDDEPEPEAPDSTAARSRRSPIELQTWLNSLATDEDPIHADDPIMAYADDAGIEFDWLLLAWDRFRQDMIERRTKKRDWRAHFRNAVRGNWYRLWWARDGGTGLTTVGEQAMMVWRAGK